MYTWRNLHSRSREGTLPLCSVLVRHPWGVGSGAGPPVQEGPGHTGESPVWGWEDAAGPGAPLLWGQAERAGAAQPGVFQRQLSWCTAAGFMNLPNRIHANFPPFCPLREELRQLASRDTSPKRFWRRESSWCLGKTVYPSRWCHALPECSAPSSNFLLKDLLSQKWHLCAESFSVHFSTSPVNFWNHLSLQHPITMNPIVCSMQKCINRDIQVRLHHLPGSILLTEGKKIHLPAKYYVTL